MKTTRVELAEAPDKRYTRKIQSSRLTENGGHLGNIWPEMETEPDRLWACYAAGFEQETPPVVVLGHTLSIYQKAWQVCFI